MVTCHPLPHAQSRPVYQDLEGRLPPVGALAMPGHVLARRSLVTWPMLVEDVLDVGA